MKQGKRPWIGIGAAALAGCRGACDATVPILRVELDLASSAASVSAVAGAFRP